MTAISDAARELLDAKEALDKVEAGEPDTASLLHPSRAWQRWCDQEYNPADDRYQAALNDFAREAGIRYRIDAAALEAAEVIVEAVSP